MKGLFTPKDYCLCVRPFNAESLGIDLAALQARIRPSFAALPGCPYDVRREQAALISEFSKGAFEGAKIDELDFYRGVSPEEQARLFSKLEPRALARVEAMRPYRFKARTRFRMDWGESGWQIAPVEVVPSQSVVATDLRSIPRVYPTLDHVVFDDPDVRRIIIRSADFVREEEPDVIELTANIWQVRLVVTNHRVASNAPEGRHQDGADYIVTAFVVTRENCQGGVSMIYTPAGELYTQDLLEEGEAYFQADAPNWNFHLWHDVTPVQQLDYRKPAIRDTLGLDFQITGRAA